jgi:protein-tyrosine phosphatase
MMNKVAERLYISDYNEARAMSQTNPLNIQADLNCSMMSDGHAGFHDIAYCRTDFPDGPAIPEPLFWRGMAFMVKEYLSGKNLLVHCAAGVSRSVTMACALMTYLGLAPNMDEALKQVKANRPQAGPAPAVFASAKQYLAEEGKS